MTQLPPPPNKTYNFYHHFGLSLRTAKDPTQFIGTCPFCFSKDNFFIDKVSGLYSCYLCGNQGNHFTFLQTLYKESLASTTSTHYIDLSENRGLTSRTLQVAGLARSTLRTDVWLIPSRNEEGKLLNLYQAIPHQKANHDPQPRVIPTSRPSPPPTRPRPIPPPANNGLRTPPPPPSRRPPPPPSTTRRPHHGLHRSLSYEIRSAYNPCQQQLYGVDLVKDQKSLILCEGHWDRLAAWEVFASLHCSHPTEDHCFSWPMELHRGIPDYFGGLLKDVAILGVPGASIFKAEWCKTLRNRHIIILYDNDKDRIVCAKCRGSDGYKAHPADAPCPHCGGTETIGHVLNPGRDGTNKILKELDETGISPLSIQTIKWLPSDPKDLRDVLCL